jgi:hypothetical protein
MGVNKRATAQFNKIKKQKKKGGKIHEKES